MNNIRIYWKKLDNTSITSYEIFIVIPNNKKDYKLGDRFNVEEYTIDKRYSLFPTNETTAYKYLEVIDVDDKYFYTLRYSDIFPNMEESNIEKVIEYVIKNLL